MSAMLYLLAIVYAVAVNRHFGGNWFPASDAELIADGIGFLIIALAVVVGAIERKRAN